MTKRHAPENPENLSTEELLARVEADNDERAARLIVKSRGAYTPTAVKHDMKRIQIFLAHLLAERGLLCGAALDYETWRSELIAENEAQVAKAELMGALPRQVNTSRIVMPGEAP